ncbi:VTT domain-containing protein, partial [Candidatus Woesearchaeota archaeon]|nr:VTT domain-containing protein [Candidatus Woesearchaeota archaeon]
MPIISTFIEFILHLDLHLSSIIQAYGVWTYLLLFSIVFFETAFVIMPILPGDSLLFAAGALAARGSLKLSFLFILLAFAAITGDAINYWIGHLLGPTLFQREKIWFLNKKYLEKTHHFYEHHGGKTIVFARFVPIIRTF